MVRPRAPDVDIDALDQCSRAELRLHWKILLGEALVTACHQPRRVPTDSQAGRLLLLVDRAVNNGWKAP
jgi:hypothetical protein